PYWERSCLGPCWPGLRCSKMRLPPLSIHPRQRQDRDALSNTPQGGEHGLGYPCACDHYRHPHTPRQGDHNASGHGTKPSSSAGLWTPRPPRLSTWVEIIVVLTSL